MVGWWSWMRHWSPARSTLSCTTQSGKYILSWACTMQMNTTDWVVDITYFGALQYCKPLSAALWLPLCVLILQKKLFGHVLLCEVRTLIMPRTEIWKSAAQVISFNTFLHVYIWDCAEETNIRVASWARPSSSHPLDLLCCWFYSIVDLLWFHCASGLF